MKATCEISLYPLQEDYRKVIIGFILKLKKNKKLKVEVNGLSTQLFGDYDVIMDVIKKEFKSVFEDNRAVFIFKMAQGERTKEALPKKLKSK